MAGGLFYYSQKSETQLTTPSPTEQPVVTKIDADWKEHSFPEIGLTFSAPPEMEVITDTQKYEDTGEAYLHTMFVQKGVGGATDYYQLYGIYQIAPTSPDDAELLKQELDNPTESIISGKKAVHGQIKGERNRFVTHILMDDGRFTLFTAEPTEENRLLSEKIINTFKFEEIN